MYLKCKRQCMPHANGRKHGLPLKTASPGIQKGPRWVRCPSCWVSHVLHPSCPDCKSRRASSTNSSAGKEKKTKQTFGDSHTTHMQVNKCLIKAYSSVTIKIIKCKVFAATCWRLRYVLEVVLSLDVFILMKLFWNLKLLFILSRSSALNIDPVKVKLNNNSNRNSLWPNFRHEWSATISFSQIHNLSALLLVCYCISEVICVYFLTLQDRQLLQGSSSCCTLFCLNCICVRIVCM